MAAISEQQSRLSGEAEKTKGKKREHRVAMALADDELQKLDLLVCSQDRSRASMARLVFLRGLESFNAQG
ncbi:hypothetical protein GMW39_10190 [Pectobacterium parmentieri]|uniref:hypothetical protein n=1 Tax=Pectobacterium parmentieri TaxID=1905730 RepID=UPI0013741C37|nr:hypothetical protein [Pectobacterium parmentieri]QHQ16202.1 hypothetical protein GMW39_10190 [Pectobacterium parmentieri]